MSQENGRPRSHKREKPAAGTGASRRHQHHGSGSLSTPSIADSPPPVNPQLSGAALAAELRRVELCFRSAVVDDDRARAADYQRHFYALEQLRKRELLAQLNTRALADLQRGYAGIAKRMTALELAMGVGDGV